ncbi:unnamed protein product [Lathyrus oleraceus]
MEGWKNVPLSKEEEEDITVNGEAEIGDGVFHRTLVEKLWTDSPFNARAFKTTMIQALRLKNNVEAQDLSKNLFLFRFSKIRDAKTILKGGHWNFDRNLHILEKNFGEQQPSSLEMHFGVFFVTT